ncbi:propanol-preferring alcohol dehydrogenase [Actinoplanes octamycinicus]|uniref:Propanol-preferring alcohol dehydrogenase n=1 Tax=Actinoplanes octamycinicus TaxID=135948 RepID=A0A7W7MCJ3_9ACTN|nr:alcohol dehydrogenase catalytic domain-containing protein [Actinoplanes octamycinicus]MBB4745201.1 propanol-preferring alcohol dehydrogenase [Actinoplanes octamycinicus]GIE62672.1 oxidoreductase [Actinoplanes octamycinicus]
MRAYRMTAWGAAPEPCDVAEPVPGPGQVLVRVAGCGLCRSDLTMRRMPPEAGERLGWRMPFTLGHETAGWLPDGTPVALVSPASCGSCRLCVRGRDNACPGGRTGRGYGRDGGLAEYVVADRRSVLPLGGLDPRHAGPLTDAGATAYHAVRRARPHLAPGGTAVVLGAGGLGAFAVQFLRILTAARVVAVDVSAERRAYAASVGAHETAEAPAGRADAVLDFVGTDETIAAGIAAVRPGGAYGLIGSAGGRLARPWFGTLPADGEVFTFQGSSIADAQEVLALAAAGLLVNQVQEFAFAEVTEAYRKLAAGTLSGRAVVLL